MSTVSATTRHRDWIGSARQAVEQAETRSIAGGSLAGRGSRPVRAVLPPDFFPGYELEREVHCGGQGIVYAAVQKSTGRRIALKVLRESAFSTPLERARFEREVQVLAALRHPNIVTIHDSGNVAGQFFFVMDFIAGQTLDTHTSARPRPIREVLALFATVCEAVDAAHVRGIIHRDIKPGNILVDAAGQPHVLDFGLAKVVESSGSPDAGLQPEPLATGSTARNVKLETRHFTETGQFIGSLPWSAPEQSDGSVAQIDMRSDVYSLGVVLYQLLTSRFPYDVVGAVRRILENIAHTPPTRPRTLRKAIDDEVETIVLKCLSKERERRYQTAGELARDLRHYLRGEPIEAKRDSGWYVLRKTLGRYRLRMAIAAAFILLIVGATIALSLLYARQGLLLVEVERERDKAVTAEQLADDRLQHAEYETYVSNIAAAAAAIAAQDGGAALKRLQSTPEALRNWEWHYLLRQADQSVATWQGPRDLITGRVRLSPDGQYVAASFWMEQRPGELRIWPRASADPIGGLTFASAYFPPFEFLGERHELLACDRDGTLSHFDPPERRKMERPALADGEQVLDFWPAEHLLLTVRQGTYRLRDTAGDRFSHALPLPGLWISRWSLDATGSRLALGLSDGIIVLVDVVAGQVLSESKAHTGTVFGTAFSPNQRLLATAGEAGELKLWELAQVDAAPKRAAAGSPAPPLRMVRELHCGVQRVGVVSFSPDGQLLAAPSEDKTVRIWSVADGQLRTTLLGHTTGVTCTDFTSDGRWLLSGARDGVVKLWDLQQSAPARAFSNLPNRPDSIAFTPDGGRLLLHGRSVDGETVCAVDVASGTRLHEHRKAPATELGDIVARPDGLQTALTDRDGSVWLSGIGADGQSRLIGKHNSWPRLASDASGHVLASADAGAVVLWSWLDGRESRRFRGPGVAVGCLALNSDAAHLALGLDSGELVVQDARSGQLWRSAAHGRRITSGAFSPDGRRLTSGSDDGTVKSWDVDTGRMLWSAAPQLGDVWCIAFSADGKRVAVGGRDRSVRLLDAGNGQELLALRGPTGTVVSLAFSPDGDRIAAGSHAGEVFIWDAADPVPVK